VSGIQIENNFDELEVEDPEAADAAAGGEAGAAGQ